MVETVLYATIVDWMDRSECERAVRKGGV